jgi:hypothetical protein
MTLNNQPRMRVLRGEFLPLESNVRAACRNPQSAGMSSPGTFRCRTCHSDDLIANEPVWHPKERK